MRLRADSRWPWLAYLGIYFFPWLMRDPRPVELAASAVLLPTFLLLYFLGHRRDPRVRLLCSAGMAVLAFVGIPWMSTSSLFLGYAAAGLGWLRPLSWALRSLAVLLLCAVLAWWVFGFPGVQLFPALFFSGMTGFACVLSAESAARERALVAAQGNVKRLATLAERERIARDMHDLLGHQLSVVAVKADLAAKLIGSDPEAARAELRDIQGMTREALHEVRLAVDGMKQASLTGELERAERALQASNVELEKTVQVKTLPPHLERGVALVLREAVTNVIRHAGAARCRVTLRWVQEEALELEVRDDGTGGGGREGHGVQGMRERVRELGGGLALEQGPNGTRLLATFPRAGQVAS
ncbi:MAG: histidine kinase [Myxococcota bacterium]